MTYSGIHNPVTQPPSTGGSGSTANVLSVANKTALKNADPATYQSTILDDVNLGGTFMWCLGNFSAVAAIDTTDAIYITSNLIANTVGIWVRIYSGDVNAKWFGAIGDNVTNNAAAFTAAASYIVNYPGRLLIPKGIYRTNGTIFLGGSGVVLTGEGQNATILMNTSAAAPTISVNSGSNNITVQDFTLDRNVAATPGGNGLSFGVGGVTDGFIYRIYSKNNYMGIALGGAGYALMQNIFCERNYADGLNIQNSNVFTTAQWYISEVLCQLNDGAGIRLQSVATLPVGGHMALGSMTNVKSFANSQQGFAVLGNATVGIYSIRANDCFFGEDGGHEVYLDTYGNLHTFNNCFVELGGSSTTGRTYSTPPTQNTYGYLITLNTPDVNIVGGIINGMSYSGIYSQCPNNGAVRIKDTIVANNGINGGVADVNTSGMVTISGTFDVVGVRAYGQRNGSFNASLGGDQFVGTDFNNNSVTKHAGNVAGNIFAGNR